MYLRLLHLQQLLLRLEILLSFLLVLISWIITIIIAYDVDFHLFYLLRMPLLLLFLALRLLLLLLLLLKLLLLLLLKLLLLLLLKLLLLLLLRLLLLLLLGFLLLLQLFLLSATSSVSWSLVVLLHFFAKNTNLQQGIVQITIRVICTQIFYCFVETLENFWIDNIPSSNQTLKVRGILRVFRINKLEKRFVDLFRIF